jgi:hypothetical protein
MILGMGWDSKSSLKVTTGSFGKYRIVASAAKYPVVLER